MDNFPSPDSLKMGWFFLSEGKSFISRWIIKVTGGRSSHTGILGGGYDIIEATFLGVGLRDIRRYRKNRLRFCSIKNMDKEQMNKMAFFAATKCGRRYHFLQLIMIAVAQKFRRIRKLFEWLNNCSGKEICSELVLDAAAQTGYNLLPTNKYRFEFMPADLEPETHTMIKEEIVYEP